MTVRCASAQHVRTIGMSMVPFIPPGSILTVSRADIAQLQPGDVICYIDETGCGVAHRIVGIERRSGKLVFVLQGDAHPQKEVVAAESVVYLVQKVRIGPFAYSCHGAWGQLFSFIAQRSAFRSPYSRRLLLNLWRGAASVRRFYRH